MRLSTWSLLLVAVPLPILAREAVRSTPASQSVVQVVVSARCLGPSDTEVTVRPWNVRLAQGDEVEWVLAGDANSDNVTITPKRTSDWPFANRNPIAGTKRAAARARGMRRNARGVYKYNIELVCQSGDNAPDRIVIDPDIIVD